MNFIISQIAIISLENNCKPKPYVLIVVPVMTGLIWITLYRFMTLEYFIQFMD